MRHLNLFAALAVGAALAASQPAAAWTFVGPLDRPALASTLAPQSPMLAVAAAGNRLVAVGQRGHIVFSDDRGSTWKQAEVPVATDLVAVTFPTEKLGWAVEKSAVKVALSSVMRGPAPVINMAITSPPRASPLRLCGRDSVPLSSSTTGVASRRTGELKL